MKNSRLELRAISEFNFMLRYKAAPAASDNQSDLDSGFWMIILDSSKSKGVKKEEGSGR